MKKFYLVLIGLVLALVCVPMAFALEVTDLSVGGAAPGASAMNRAPLFSAQYDYAAGSVDGTNIVQLLTVPEGVLATYAVVTPADLNWTTAITLYRKLGTNAWAAVGGAQTVTTAANVPILYHLALPTYTAANTNAANVEVTVTVDSDIALAATALNETKWGFVGAVSGTNSLPTTGTLDIGVFGADVLPALRY